MRRVLMVLVLLLAAVARAEDDDAVLETPSLGDPIPERTQALEKEWDDDVGTKDHAPDPTDEPAPDPFERNATPAPDDEPEVEAKTPPPCGERPEPAKRASTLEEPLARDPPADKTPPKSIVPPPKLEGAERRAADLKAPE